MATDQEKVTQSRRWAKFTSGKGRGMEDKRSCVWMQGPRETTLQVAAKHRPPVTCDMTPKFVSPLEHQKHG